MKLYPSVNTIPINLGMIEVHTIYYYVEVQWT